MSPLYSNAVKRKLMAIRMPSGYTFLVCLGSLLGVFRIVGSSSGLVLVSVCLGFSSLCFFVLFWFLGCKVREKIQRPKGPVKVAALPLL